MTSQSRDKAANKLADIPDGKIIYVKDGPTTFHSTVQPAVQYHVADDTDERLKKLEGDINFLRGLVIDLYGKCPKMEREFGYGKKKNKKQDDVDCENCGGLLW